MGVSARIKKVMKDKKFTAQKLADEIGISRRTVENTFFQDTHGENFGMTFDNVIRYANALGCDVIIRDRETGKEY